MGGERWWMNQNLHSLLHIHRCPNIKVEVVEILFDMILVVIIDAFLEGLDFFRVGSKLFLHVL